VPGTDWKYGTGGAAGICGRTISGATTPAGVPAAGVVFFLHPLHSPQQPPAVWAVFFAQAPQHSPDLPAEAEQHSAQHAQAAFTTFFAQQPQHPSDAAAAAAQQPLLHAQAVVSFFFEQGHSPLQQAQQPSAALAAVALQQAQQVSTALTMVVLQQVPHGLESLHWVSLQQSTTALTAAFAAEQHEAHAFFTRIWQASAQQP
jgi:hypothetical protein